MKYEEILEFFIEHTGPPPPPPDSAPPVDAPLAFIPLTLRLELAGTVSLDIYDSRGRLVRTLWRDELDAGQHDIVWRGDDSAGRSVASGSYFALARCGDRFARLSMSLVR